MVLDQHEAACARIQNALSHAVLSAVPASQAALAAINEGFPNAGLELQAHGRLTTKAFTRDDRDVFEDMLRQFLVQMVADAVSTGQPLMQFVIPLSQTSQPSLARFLDMVYWLSETMFLEPIAPNVTKLLDSSAYCKLLEDVLELGTIQDCKDMFSYMENIMELFKKEQGQQGPAKLTILRACNNLLKRLSKAQDVQLCGRILIFIAKLYPLADKSGVNLHGLINSGLPLPIDEVPPDAVDSSGEPINARLYCTFWNLQNVFKNPGQVLQPGVWAKTTNDISVVLEEFSKQPITVAAGLPSIAATNTQSDGVTSVKYLSSSKLFGLQLRDATFRRHFLVQCLTLTHFISHLGKSDRPPAAKLEGVDDLNNKIYAALMDTKENGRQFADAAQHILKRETQWVEWKNASCPPFERPPAPPTTPMGPAIGGEPAPKRRRMVQGWPAVRAAMTKLVGMPEDQMSGLKVLERKTLLPSLRAYLSPVIEDMDPENDIEQEYRRKNDKVFAWKALRMLSQNHLEKFSACKDDLEKAVLEIFPDVKDQFDAYRAQQQQLEQQQQQQQEDGPTAATQQNGEPDGPSTAPAVDGQGKVQSTIDVDPPGMPGAKEDGMEGRA